MKIKNKKGFTLIELLAVIVVLAIIALIATPIVMNTIKKSQKGAAERSADNYREAVETIVATERLNGNILEGTYTINDKGNLEGNGLTEPLTIEMNGNKPIGGTIIIKNGQVTPESTMTVGSYVVAYNPTSKKYEATEKRNESLICDLQEGTSQTVGAKYTCHLDSDRTFYVLETSGDNVSLIMDRNFADDTVSKTLAWCIDGGDDNTTCRNINSKEEGTPLKHIQDMFGAKVNVSIPSASQIAIADNKNYEDYPALEQVWLYDYLEGTPNSVSGVYGYWTATIDVGNTAKAWSVINGNLITSSIPEYGYVDSNINGLRPVITVSKSKLS